MQIPDEEYFSLKKALSGLTAPLLYVDIDRFDNNLQKVAKLARGIPIRVASKSIRCVDLIKRCLENPAFRGVMAYSPAEAYFLAQSGIDDILIGYPSLEIESIKLLVGEVAKGKKIVFMSDSVAHLRFLQDAASKSGQVLSIALDLDLSVRLPLLHFGVHRSPIQSIEDLKPYLTTLQSSKNLKLIGLMAYEAQIAGLDDRHGKSFLKKATLSAIQSRRHAMVEQLKSRGFLLDFVNGGGSGSLTSTRRDSSVTELTAGSALYAPTLFDHYHSLDLTPALGFMLRVQRKPASGMVTCFSGGFIASGPTGPDRQPTPYLPRGLNFFNLEGAGEVQTPLHGVGALELSPGDPVFFRPAKAGEICERFNEIFILKGLEVMGSAKTYRGQGMAFG